MRAMFNIEIVILRKAIGRRNNYLFDVYLSPFLFDDNAYYDCDNRYRGGSSDACSDSYRKHVISARRFFDVVGRNDEVSELVGFERYRYVSVV